VHRNVRKSAQATQQILVAASENVQRRVTEPLRQIRQEVRAFVTLRAAGIRDLPGSAGVPPAVGSRENCGRDARVPRNTRFDDYSHDFRKRKKLPMLIELKLRRKNYPLRRGENLTSERSTIALFVARNVVETAMAAIEVLGVETEVPDRFLDQMRTRAEERKVVNADDDVKAAVDEPQHTIERHAVHPFEMDRARAGDGY